MAQTKYIAISSQKGGVGKTTVTIIAASAFHHLGGIRTAVVDCDFPQQSIVDFRDKELSALQRELTHLQQDPEANGKRIEEIEAAIADAYPVIGCMVKDAAAQLQALDGQVDLVFVDTPGTMNAEGIVDLWARLDYIFIPVEPDKISVSSTISYIDTIQEIMQEHPGSRLKGIYPFWNKYIKSEKRTMYDRTEQYFADNDIRQLDARLEHSVNYRKDEMRSTMFPLKKQFLDLGVRSLIEEMSNVIFADAVPAGAEADAQ
ncbi:ParA family protein [Solirubrum puertoriconensis]|nr:ParA family protein [Solirubrum puertoriconensis]